MKYIKITHNGENGCTVEAEGFEGKACSNATAAITKALGMDDRKMVKKPEYDRESRLKTRG